VLDLALTIIAVFLAVTSVEKYRFIASIVALEFVLHVLAYNYLFLDYRADPENGWLIYLTYVVIQLPIMAILSTLKSHFAITALIFINLTYNLLTTASYFYESSVNFYQAYQYFVGSIMIFELIYLGLLSKYVNSRDTKDLNHFNPI